MHPPYGPADGTLYTLNLRGALLTDVYTCIGEANAPTGEAYTPTFTQLGFRYGKITGLRFPLAERNILPLRFRTRCSFSIQVTIPAGVAAASVSIPLALLQEGVPQTPLPLSAMHVPLVAESGHTIYCRGKYVP